MAQVIRFFLIVTLYCAAMGAPVDNSIENTLIVIDKQADTPTHSLWKRFINPSLTSGGFSNNLIAKMRTKRSIEEQCEKLELCKLHSRSAHNFFAAFELYFVNKENARLWDHRRHSEHECERKFGRCYNDLYR